MRRGKFLEIAVFLILAMSAATAPHPVLAATPVDATWIGATSPGSWTSTANWSGGAYPNGVGDTARLTRTLTGPFTVTLNAPITVGTLVLGGGGGYTVDSGTAGSLILDDAAGVALIGAEGSHTILAPVALNDGLSIRNGWDRGLGYCDLWLRGVVAGGPASSITVSAGTAGLTGPGATAQTGAANVHLTAASTFQGTATVLAGPDNWLALREWGTATSAASFTLEWGANLCLDNTAVNLPDRVASRVTLNGGAVRFYGAAGDLSTEELPQVLALAGTSVIESAHGDGGQALLTLSDLGTGYGTAVRFSGRHLGTNDRILISPAVGGPWLYNDLIGGWAVVGEDFATYDYTQGVVPLAQYALVDINLATPADNLAVGAPAALTASRRVNSLKLASGGSVDLAASTLNIESGGLILAQPDPGVPTGAIAGGNLTAGGTLGTSELIIHLSTSKFTIGANIVDNPGGGIDLVVSGDGAPAEPGGPTLALTGQNTYAGPTYVNSATLAVDTDARLGQAAGAVTLVGGTLRAAGDFTSQRTVQVQGMAAIETPGTTLTLAGPLQGGVETLYVRGGGSLVLAADSPLSAAVDVGVGQHLVLAGAGKMPYVSEIALRPGAELKLDNTAANASGRFTGSVTSRGGQVSLVGGAGGTVGETLPEVDLEAGASVIRSSSSGAAMTMTISYLGCAPGATADFRTSGGASRILLQPPSGPTLRNGLLGAWAVDGNDFATVNPASGAVRPLAAAEYYTGSLNLAQLTDNVKITGAAAVTRLQGINSLKMAAPTVLNLNGNLLSLESGGLLIGSETNSQAAIVNGFLTVGAFGSPANELVIHLRSDAYLGASITEGSIPISLTVSGDPVADRPYVLDVSFPGYFTGPTSVNAATLAIYDDSCLGTGGAPLRLVAATLRPDRTLSVGRPVSVEGQATFDVSADQNLTLAGIVSGNVETFRATGAGELALTNSNTFRGLVLVGDPETGGPQSAGPPQGVRLQQAAAKPSLRIGQDSGLGDPANGVTLNSGRLHVTGTFEAGLERVFTVGASGGTFDVDENQTFSLAAPGQLAAHDGEVIKAGLGKMILGGPNLDVSPPSLFAPGARVTAGALELRHPQALPVLTRLEGGTLGLRGDQDADFETPVLVQQGTLDVDSLPPTAGNPATNHVLSVPAITFSDTGVLAVTGAHGYGLAAERIETQGHGTVNTASANLTLTGGLWASSPSGGSLTKQGPASLVVNGPVASAGPVQLTAEAGVLILNADVRGQSSPTLTALGVANSGTTALLNTTQHLQSLSLAGGAHVDLAAGGSKVIVTASLSVEEAGGLPTSRLDLADNDMIIDYTDPAASPLQNVKRWIASACDGRLWDGNGITSTAAMPNSLTCALGYADNGSLFTRFTTFDGEPVDSTTVLVKYTYIGDVNLDGKVDDNDVTILALRYDHGATSTHLWQNGDIYGYDGKIDDNDVTLLVLNYRKGIGSPLGETSAAVPEPATLALLALGLGAIVGRRRRQASLTLQLTGATGCRQRVRCEGHGPPRPAGRGHAATILHFTCD